MLGLRSLRLNAIGLTVLEVFRVVGSRIYTSGNSMEKLTLMIMRVVVEYPEMIKRTASL